MRFFSKKKEKDYQRLRTAYSSIIPLFVLLALIALLVSLNFVSEFNKKIDSAYTEKSRSFYKHSNLSTYKVSSSKFARNLSQLFSAHFLNRNLAAALADKEKELGPINRYIRKRDLFEHKLAYAEKEQVMASREDKFGQMIIWRNSLGVQPNERGDGYVVTFDKKMLDHLERFTLLGLMLSQTGRMSSVPTTKSLNGPFEKPYSYMYPSIIGRYVRVLYPGYSDTNRWKFFIPPVREHWQGYLQKTTKEIEEAVVLSPIYLDAITGKPTISMLDPLIVNRQLEASIITDWFNKELSSTFLDEYTNNNIIWFTGAKHILNSTARIREFLSIDEKKKYLIPKILNRYVHNYKFEDSNLESVKKVECKESTSQQIRLGKKRKFHFICFPLKTEKFHFVSEGGILKDRFYLGFFLKEKRTILPNSFDQKLQIAFLVIGFFVLLYFELSLLFSLKRSIYFSIYQIIYPKSSVPKLVTNRAITYFDGELTNLQKTISQSDAERDANIQVIDSAKGKLSKILEYTSKKLDIFSCSELDLFQRLRNQEERKLFSIFYNLHTNLKEDIDDLFVSKHLKDESLELEPLNVSILLGNLLHYLQSNSSLKDANIDDCLNNIDLSLNNDSTVLADKEQLLAILTRILNQISHFFKVNQIILSSEIIDKKFAFTIEFSGLSLQETLQKYFDLREFLIHTLKVLKDYVAVRSAIFRKIGLEKIDFDIYEENESIRVALFFIENTPAKSKISSSQIYKLNTDEIENGFEVFSITDEKAENYEFAQENDFALKTLSLTIHQYLSIGKRVIVLVEALSASHSYPEIFNHLNENFPNEPVFILHLEYPNYSFNGIEHWISQALNNHRSFFYSNHFIANIRNEMIKERALRAYQTISDVTVLKFSSSSFNENNQLLLETAHKKLDFEFYQGADDFFHKNNEGDDRFDEFFFPCAYFTKEDEKYHAILRIRYATLNFVTSRDIPFDSFHHSFLEYLGTQTVVAEHKFLNFSYSPHYLKIFQSILKKSKKIVLIKKMSGNKSLLFLVDENGDLQEEIVSVTFYITRRYLEEIFDNFQDQVLINIEIIKDYYKKIPDPELRSLIDEYLS